MVAAEAQVLLIEWCQTKKRQRMRWSVPQLVSLLAAQILDCNCEVRYKSMTVGGYLKCQHVQEAAVLLDGAIAEGLLQRTKHGITSDHPQVRPEDEVDSGPYEVITEQEYRDLSKQIEDDGAKRTASWTSPVVYQKPLDTKTTEPEDQEQRRERRTEQARLRERQKREMQAAQRTSRTPLKDHRDEVIQLVRSGSTVSQISALFCTSYPATREFVRKLRR